MFFMATGWNIVLIAGFVLLTFTGLAHGITATPRELQGAPRQVLVGALLAAGCALAGVCISILVDGPGAGWLFAPFALLWSSIVLIQFFFFWVSVGCLIRPTTRMIAYRLIPTSTMFLVLSVGLLLQIAPKY